MLTDALVLHAAGLPPPCGSFETQQKHLGAVQVGAPLETVHTRVRLHSLAHSVHKNTAWQVTNAARRLDAWANGQSKVSSCKLTAVSETMNTGYLKDVVLTNGAVLPCTDGAPGLNCFSLSGVENGNSEWHTRWSIQQCPAMGSQVTCIAASDDHVATANFSGGVHVHALSNAQPCGQFSVPGSLAAGAPPGTFSQNRDEEHTVKRMRWIHGSEQLFCAGSSSAHAWSVDVAASREKTQLPQALAAGDKIGTNKHGGLVCCGNMLAQVMAPAQKTELEKDLPYMRYELIGAADAKGSVGATINGGGFGDTPWGQPFLKTAQGFAKPALTIWLIQETSLKVAHVRRFDDGGVLSVSVDQQPLGPPRIASGHENGDVRVWSHEAHPLLKVRMAAGGIQGPPGVGAVGFLALQGNALAALASNCYGAVLRVWDLTKIEVPS